MGGLLSDFLDRHRRIRALFFSALGVGLVGFLTARLSALVDEVKGGWALITIGIAAGLVYLLCGRWTRSRFARTDAGEDRRPVVAGVMVAVLSVGPLALLIFALPIYGSYAVRSSYQVVVDTFLVAIGVLAFFILMIVPALARRGDSTGAQALLYKRFSGVSSKGVRRGTDPTDPANPVWNPSEEERRAHLVKIYNGRPSPDDPDQYEPYFVAICACDWVGDPCDTADEAIRNARNRHSSNIQPELVRPVG